MNADHSRQVGPGEPSIPGPQAPAGSPEPPAEVPQGSEHAFPHVPSGDSGPDLPSQDPASPAPGSAVAGRPIPWPGGPIPPPQPTELTRVDSPTVHRSPEGSRGRILVPLVSAFLGAGLALGAAAGLGVFAEETPTVTTTVAVDQAAEAVAPPAEASTTLQLREAGVDAVQVGEVVIPSIVSVQVGQDIQVGFREAGSGSGVVYDGAGHIITNDHVAAGGSAYRVTFADGRVYEATLVGTDPVTDLAVLKIEADDLVPIQLGSSDGLSVGDPAVAVGSPLGLEGGPSLTVGVLSAFNRQVQTSGSEILYGMLQTDAPITQGSSGGALVDGTGRLIGITTAVGVSRIGVEGIGFATPVEIVERAVNEIIADGEAGTAFLGIVGGTSFDTAGDGAEIPVGVEIASVEPSGSAATAGLRAGDLIVSFGSKPVQTMQDLIVLLRRSYVGDSVEMTVERGGVQEVVDLVLGEK